MEGFKQIVGLGSRIKPVWSGNDKGTGGVGVLLREEWWRRCLNIMQTFPCIMQRF